MLKVKGLTFAYDKIPVLKNVNFTINAGQHIALIGASGCGKSTLLKLVYGLLQPNEGSLYWKENQILGPLHKLVPGEAYMKYLSQGFELQSYRTVAENIGEHLSNFDKELKQERISELLNIVEMVPYEHVKVETLSGGQKQRVALARSLAKKPELLLLDEPFGNIDNFRRSSLRRNLFRYLKRSKITCITATHDQTDILSFADQTIVIKEGEIVAKEETTSLYNNPSDPYIASLFGEVNTIKVASFTSADDTETILVYPHEILVSTNANTKVRVKKSYFNGSHYLIKAVLNNKVLFFNHHEALKAPIKVGVRIKNDILINRDRI